MLYDIHNYAKIGIVLTQAYPEASKNEMAFLAALKKILVDDYFDLLEISQLPFASLNDVVPAIIKASHMDFTYCGHSRLFASKLNINSLDETERVKAVEEMKRGLDEAHAFGASEYQFLSRTYDETKIAEHIDALAKSTREICEYAKQYNIPVTLEIFDYDVDKKSLLGPIDRVVAFMEKVKDLDNFGFMVDCSHIPLIRETLSENMDPIKDKILHAHMGNAQFKIKDDAAYGDMHPRFGYPGGENDTEYLAEFLQKLKDYGYLYEGGNNDLSFEIRPVPGEDPDLVIANAKRTLNAAWRMVK